MIFIRYPFYSNVKVLDLGSPLKTDRIKDEIAFSLGINGFSLLHNGKILLEEDVVPDNSTVHVTFSLPGGKGGFGSMLRAIGAQIEKTTNREACRDLSGRRLRDINEEQRLKKWIAKESEREAEKIKRRQARIERLKTKAPHKFFDYEYEKEISELPDRVNDALSEGLQKAKQPKKRPYEAAESSVKPKKTWLAEDLSDSSSDSDSGGSDIREGDEPKKQKTASKSLECHTVTSKDCVAKDFTSEESTSSDPGNAFKAEYNSDSNEHSVNHEKEEQNMDLNENSTQESSKEMEKSCEIEDIKVDSAAAEQLDLVMETEEHSSGVSGTETNDPGRESGSGAVAKEVETKDDSPIDLTNFQSVSELEALGLDKLKSALMMRGLKCGGTLSDRAQRLWKIRDLQPREYPANLLAKSKK